MLRICRLFVSVCLMVLAKAAAASSVSVLFVGNSLTHANDLPSIFRKFAAESQLHVDVDVSSITPGGALLSDHWKREQALTLLREKHPKFLILQGQSTEPLFAPRDFSYYAALFKAEADRVGATTILFATWARPARDSYYQHPSSGGSPPEMQRRLNAGYALVAKQIGAELAPAGQAFELAQHQAPKIELLDGTQHPSFAGTYLAAAVLFRVIFNMPAASSNYDGGLPPQTADVLRRIADEVSAGDAK